MQTITLGYEGCHPLLRVRCEIGEELMWLDWARGLVKWTLKELMIMEIEEDEH